MSKREEARIQFQGQERHHWSHPIEFFCCLLAGAVSMVTIVRFPYLMFKNGGVVFLIPTLVCAFFLAVPLYFLEIYVGQKSQGGFISCWGRFTPILKGVGYTILLLLIVQLTTYQVLVTWVMTYLVSSYRRILPWSDCANYWNTDLCKDPATIVHNLNVSATDPSQYEFTLTPEEEYFNNKILAITDGIEDFGGLNIPLVIAHVVGCVLIYICTILGFRSLGKVLFLTSTIPYLLGLALLARGLTLPGSRDGVKYFLYPGIYRLTDFSVWSDAMMNTVISLLPTFGVILTLGSYNKPTHNFIWAPFIVPFIEILTGIFFGTILFSFVGYQAHMANVDINQVVTSGMDVFTLMMPGVLKHLPVSQAWSIGFYLFLFLIMFDNQCLIFQSCVSAIKDEFHLGSRLDKLLAFGFLGITVSLGLFFVSRAGIYYLTLIDYFFYLLAPCLCLVMVCVCVTWVYGCRRIGKDLTQMTGIGCMHYITIPFWGILLPLLSLGGFVLTMVINYNVRPIIKSYLFPTWSVWVGWGIAVLMLLPMLFYTIIRLCIVACGDSNFGKLFSPEEEPNEGIESIAFQSFSA